MRQQGVTDPYVRLMAPPGDYGRLRRHLHDRYNFEPLLGYPSEW